MCTIVVLLYHVKRMHYVTSHTDIQVRERCKLSASESKITHKGRKKIPQRSQSPPHVADSINYNQTYSHKSVDIQKHKTVK